MSQEIYVKPKKVTPLNILLIILGTTLYALSVNLFLVPLKLYSGGVPGTAQMIRTLFLSNVKGVDTAGIINLAFNIPLFILAFKTMKKRMLAGTILSVALQTIIFTYVVAPATPILDDKLACIVIAALVGGVGCGLILTNSASAGGLDLLGLFLSHKSKRISVGLFNILYNGVLFTLMAILFDVSTTLYSIIYIVIFSVTIDRWHYQNIEVELMIFTHVPAVKQMIMQEYARGVTAWDGKGAYTNNHTEVLVTIVAKSEVNSVQKEIRKLDPEAFVITHTRVNVIGGYQKRLV